MLIDHAKMANLTQKLEKNNWVILIITHKIRVAIYFLNLYFVKILFKVCLQLSTHIYSWYMITHLFILSLKKKWKRLIKLLTPTIKMKLICWWWIITKKVFILVTNFWKTKYLIGWVEMCSPMHFLNIWPSSFKNTNNLGQTLMLYKEHKSYPKSS